MFRKRKLTGAMTSACDLVYGGPEKPKFLVSRIGQH